VQAYFWRKYLFWERPNFGKEDLILEHAQQMERKQHAKKEGKTTCKRKSNVARRKDKPNHDRVRVFDKDCNDYKPVK
jgi:ribosomal protein S9